MAPPALRGRHLLEVDGLRGAAILFVLVYHFIGVSLTMELPQLLSQGVVDVLRQCWLGVDLFFVLSGFLIGGILLDSRGSPRFFRTFYARRFFRIVPLYLVLFALNLMSLAHLIPRAPSPARADIPWYAYLTFTQNYWLARGPVGVPSFMGVTWSIAVEEQFYLVMPLVVRFVSERLLPWVLLAVMVASLAFRLQLYQALGPEARRAAYELTHCRADTLAMGCLAAYLLRRASVWQALARSRAVLFGLLALFAAGAPYFLMANVVAVAPLCAALMYTWLGLLFTCALVLAVVHADSWFGALLRASWLRKVGGLAYCLYLFHTFIIFIILAWSGPYVPRTPVNVAALLVLGLGLSFALAILSWRYFEQPLIAMGRRAKY